MVVFLGRPSSRMLGHMLSFSAGVMLFISFIDLMPEAVASVGFGVANVAFFVGMFLFWLVVQFIPEVESDVLFLPLPSSLTHPFAAGSAQGDLGAS